MVNFWMVESSWTIGLSNLCGSYCMCKHVRGRTEMLLNIIRDHQLAVIV
jgi:hypothetical protein